MNEFNRNAYAAHIHRLIEHIEAHLDGDLSLERLSRVAGFSKYHLHRQFTATTGTTIARLTRLLRLKRATWSLAFSPEKKVIDIAFDAGFSNPETFARAFKEVHGQSPSEFRKAPKWRDWSDLLKGPKRDLEIRMKAEITEFENTAVAAYEHHGSPARVMESVGKFMEWRRGSQASPELQCRSFGIVYSDPENTAPDEFRFDICGELKEALEGNAYGIVQKSLPGGRYVKARHLGSLDTIGESVRWIYTDWLPQSGEALGDFPCFFHYKKRMPHVSEHEQVTDIFLALR